MRYECDLRFNTYYLQDSYVMGMDESDPSRIAFSLLLVLTPEHLLYAKPLPSEQHCYRRGVLAFCGVSSVNWTRRNFRPMTDATGEIDYGNIDIFELGPDNLYELDGDWGHVSLTAESASITLDRRVAVGIE
jgi:hypothetical protein